jgi:hypothetical protein
MDKYELTEQGMSLQKAGISILFSGNELDTAWPGPFTVNFAAPNDELAERAYRHPSGDGAKYFRLKPAAPKVPSTPSTVQNPTKE